MSSIRQQKVEELIHHCISNLLCFEVNNPHLENVSITQVHMSPDLKLAKVYFHCPEGAEREKEIIKGFQQSKRFIKKQMAGTVKLKFSPDLKFYYDNTEDEYNRVEQLLTHIESPSYDEES